MKFINDEKALAWTKGLEINTDPYGAGIYAFAQKWAELMEEPIADGLPLEEIAKPLCRIADDEGITGFMYGAAVSLLADCWLHGETLRRWHNLDVQIRDEGERANETGGTLNPALMSISRPE